MWGTSSPGDKLTGDFGNRPDATSISDRGLFRLLAGNLSPGVFRLLQHNRHEAADRGSGSLARQIRFSPAILPPYARSTKSLVLIPILHLRAFQLATSRKR
jgi:hypothetical protein